MPQTDFVWQCRCGSVLRIKDFIRHELPQHPKTGHSEEVLQCPECGSVEDPERKCDELGCGRKASGGYPTPDGYRTTCWEHSPDNPANKATVE